VQAWFIANEVPSFIVELKKSKLVKAAIRKGIFEKGSDENKLELSQREQEIIRIMKNVGLGVELVGSSYATCQGRYELSKYIRNGKPVWVRNYPDDSRFAWYQEDYWAITGSQWMEAILAQDDGVWSGFFVRSTNLVDDFTLTEWEGMHISA